MKKLYRVTIEAIVFVLADDEYDAENVVRRNRDDCDFAYFPMKVKKLDEVDKCWHDARPFTAQSFDGYIESDPTCAQIIEQQKQEYQP